MTRDEETVYFGEAGTNDHLDEIRDEEEEEGITREAQRAEKDGRVQSKTGVAHGSGGGSPVPTAREEIEPSTREVRQFRSKVYAGIEAAREAGE